MTAEDHLAALNRDLGAMNRDLGELSGLFKAHMKEVNRERAASRSERQADRADRKAIGETLRKLADKTDEIDPLKERVGKIEPVAEEYKSIKQKIAGAVVLAGGIWALVGAGFYFFGAELKALVLRMLRIS